MYPELILNSLSLPTYFLVNTLTAIITLFWLLKRTLFKKLSIKLSLEIYLIVSVAGFFGARAFHAFYEQPFYYLNKPSEFFFFWQGGFVFYGGALLGFFAGWTYIQFKDKKNTLNFLDLFTPLAAFSYSLGRLGCFLAGCCYGKIDSIPWSIDGRHPTQIYSSAWEGLTLFALIFFEKKLSTRPGVLFFLWILLHSIGHLIVEQYRGDDRGFQYMISVSSWVSLGLILISITFLIKTQTNNPRS
ncbi:MAG TPA: prolipoprotein diacylglyceryl transferase [Pseudobdellovibrionaceae bacterium]|nr:prolipoprotein diacylglyceryl transferase [Pseudobdellovibrionaceae bacterium]